MKRRNLKRVEVTARSVVCIEINGRYVDDYTARDDDGLISRFRRWADNERIYSAVAGHSGAGMLRVFYSVDDAVRIVEWLTKQGYPPQKMSR